MPASPTESTTEARPPEEGRALTREILLERAQLDFEDGMRHAHERIREAHSAPVAATLNALVTGALRALRLRSELRRDVAHVLDLAEDVAGGADPKAVAEENLPRVLKLTHLQVLVRTKDAAFDEAMDRARAIFAARLPDLAAMVTVSAPTDYADLVRRAFPDEAHARRIVDEQARFVHDVIDHFDAHPHLLRVPRRMVPRVAETARHTVDWQVEKVGRSLDAIYHDGRER